MNLAEFKSDFYRRCGASDNFLHYTAAGVLCTLLGYSDIEYMPCLTFTLSMKMQMLSRKMNGMLINIEDTASDKCFSYRFGTSPNLFRDKERFIASLTEDINPPCGAQILCDCTIPEFLSRKEAFSVSLVRSLLKVGGRDADSQDIVSLCTPIAGDVSHITAILSSRGGYCTYSGVGSPKNIPLPLSGYKIISAHCTAEDKKKGLRKKVISNAFEKIRTLFPHIMSFSDITPDILAAAPSIIKDNTAIRYITHLAGECERIKYAAAALERCNVRGLFSAMAMSQKSALQLWDVCGEHKFLSHCCTGVDGIEAVRFWENGIIIIAREDKIDYVINMIRAEFEANIGYQPTFCISEPF